MGTLSRKTPGLELCYSDFADENVQETLELKPALENENYRREAVMKWGWRKS